MRLNVLVRDLGGIPRYFHLDHAEIPLSPHTLHTKSLIRLLLTLRNVMIVNRSLLMQALEQASTHPPRNVNPSPTVSSPPRGIRFVNLEQNDKEKTIHIAKLGDEIKEIKQSSVNTIPTKMANSDISGQVISQNKDVLASDITDNTSSSDELNNAPNSDVSLPTTSSIQSSHTSNSEDKINEDVKSLPETKVNTSANSTHDRTYFRNKILEQYPDLYYEFNSENVDYYGITAKTLCPLCELNHEEGVEGRYETGNMNNTQTNSDKILTSEYLDWYAKLTDKCIKQNREAEPYYSRNSPISRTNPNKMECLYKYAIEHGEDPDKFSIITEAEKNRWAMRCFRDNLERDIRYYHSAIERKEDPRKYHKFLTDRDRLIGEELLHHNILKSEMPLIQEIIEGFFKDKSKWSLFAFLQYREKEYDFTYDRRQEHKLYKKSLEVLSKDHIQARECLSKFEVKLNVIAITQPDAHVPTGCQPTSRVMYVKTSADMESFWRMVDKKRCENEIEHDELHYVRCALNDTNGEMHNIHAIMTDKTIRTLKYGLEGQVEKSESCKSQDQEEIQMHIAEEMAHMNFTSEEWQMIIQTNPYTINDPVVPAPVSNALHEAVIKHSSGQDSYMHPDETPLSRTSSQNFNGL
nr:13639_t:CDS:10 [Entrophospora candida]